MIKKEPALKDWFFFFSAGIDLFFQVVANQVFSTRKSLTSVFGMGTGGASLL